MARSARVTPDAHGGFQLAVVLPVHNEEASIERVLREWWMEVERQTPSFRFLVVDDGSTDRTPAVLANLQSELGNQLLCECSDNRGHGQACLAGYRWAAELGARHVLQIDSDGQCDPCYFARLWALRGVAPVVYGRRVRRDDGFGRLLASTLLRHLVRMVTGARCTDPNVPYRLMQMSVTSPFVRRVPTDFDLANVALAVLLARAGVPEQSVPIRFGKRYGGQPSVRLVALAAKAAKLVGQLRKLDRA